MTIFLILPFSWVHQNSCTNGVKNGVEYCEAEKVENGIGYFKKDENINPLGFYCKTVNDFFEIGNVKIEKCTYDSDGNKN